MLLTEARNATRSITGVNNEPDPIKLCKVVSDWWVTLVGLAIYGEDLMLRLVSIISREEYYSVYTVIKV